MNPLLEAELDEIPAQDEMQRERFRITDLATASWAFRKLRALREDVEGYRRLAQAEQERIAFWLEKQTDDAQRGISFFEALLTDYYLEQREIDNKFKLSTPHGKVTGVKRDKWTYNEAILVESLKANGLAEEFVNVTLSPKKSEIKAAKDNFRINELGWLYYIDGDKEHLIKGVVVEKNVVSVSVKTE